MPKTLATATGETQMTADTLVPQVHPPHEMEPLDSPGDSHRHPPASDFGVFGSDAFRCYLL